MLIVSYAVLILPALACPECEVSPDFKCFFISKRVCDLYVLQWLAELGSGMGRGKTRLHSHLTAVALGEVTCPSRSWGDVELLGVLSIGENFGVIMKWLWEPLSYVHDFCCVF